MNAWMFFSRFTSGGPDGTQSCGTTLVPGGVEAVPTASCDDSTGLMVDGGDAASSGLVPGDVVRFPFGNLSGRSPVPGCGAGVSPKLSVSSVLGGSFQETPLVVGDTSTP